MVQLAAVGLPHRDELAQGRGGNVLFVFDRARQGGEHQRPHPVLGCELLDPFLDAVPVLGRDERFIAEKRNVEVAGARRLQHVGGRAHGDRIAGFPRLGPCLPRLGDRLLLFPGRIQLVDRLLRVVAAFQDGPDHLVAEARGVTRHDHLSALNQEGVGNALHPAGEEPFLLEGAAPSGVGDVVAHAVALILHELRDLFPAVLPDIHRDDTQALVGEFFVEFLHVGDGRHARPAPGRPAFDQVELAVLPGLRRLPLDPLRLLEGRKADGITYLLSQRAGSQQQGNRGEQRSGAESISGSHLFRYPSRSREISGFAGIFAAFVKNTRKGKGGDQRPITLQPGNKGRTLLERKGTQSPRTSSIPLMKLSP